MSAPQFPFRRRTATPLRRNVAPRGKCSDPDCPGTYTLKADGTLRGHKNPGQYITDWCPGSWKPPRKEGTGDA